MVTSVPHFTNRPSSGNLTGAGRNVFETFKPLARPRLTTSSGLGRVVPWVLKNVELLNVTFSAEGNSLGSTIGSFLVCGLELTDM